MLGAGGQRGSLLGAALAQLVVVLTLLYDLAKVVYATFEDAFKLLLRRVVEAVGEDGA